MTNDTSTLTGALKEAGETLAANLTTQGVPSTWDEGLTTLIGKVLDITPGPGPTPTPSSILLTADKSILSYADSESATLSATVLDSSDNPLEGVTVTFYNGSTSMGTADTDSSGVATKTYASVGVGDVSFTAEIGMISSETYTIEDCIKAGFNGWTGTYNTGTDTYSYIQPNNSVISPNLSTIPAHFEMSFKLKSPSVSGDTPKTLLWNIGTDINNGVLIGNEGSSHRIRVYSRSNESNTAKQTINNVFSDGVWFDVKITYNNGVISLLINGQTVSYSLSSVSFLQTYSTTSQCKIAEWKIKPL